tara:strand:- start:1618 stop:2712 length:1095 start_codon:yes stop_codon:yes gene_type:complete
MSLVPEYIKNLTPYKAGKHIDDVKREYSIDNIIKLASNENPRGPSENVLSSIKNAHCDISLYPDPNGYQLRKKLSKKFDLNIDNVVLGSGSEGIMANIMRTFLNEKDRILATKNSFIGFRVLAQASGKSIDWVPMKNYRYNLELMSKAINEKTKIIYLANPDNPTGSYFKKTEFDNFMKEVPSRVLVILDEAYYEYASKKSNYPDSMSYRYDNVITLRTFSKAYGLAGLRVGYGFAHSELISNLMKVKLPFEPSSLAQVAALAAIEDKNYLNSTLDLNERQIEKLEKILITNNISFIPSAANFITLIFNDVQEAKNFTQEFLMNGIILRHLKSFGHPECVRVSTGNEKEMDIFVQQLLSIMEKI